MIKEAYCSYDISKLLKEKGFDGEFHTTYDDEGYTQPSITHQMACAWLREERGVYIEIRRTLNTYLYGAIIAKGAVEKCRINSIYNSYKEAVEAALKYALENLI